MASDNKIEFKVVVNGNPITLGANVNQPLGSLLNPALKEAGVAGNQDKDRWIFTDAAGKPLDKEAKIGALGILAGATLFLSLEAGAAG
jgi:hypothetical protein